MTSSPTSGTWDKGNLNLSEIKKKEMLQYEYARSALKLGLEHEAQAWDENPYKFGQIGSTDSHTGMTTADDDNFFGKHAGSEPSPRRTEHVFAKFGELRQSITRKQLASGYIAVWSKENTRASLFDAMQRKEVYGTTGPRMTVRFFGGWDFSSADLKDRARQSRLPEGRADGRGPEEGAVRKKGNVPDCRVERSQSAPT